MTERTPEGDLIDTETGEIVTTHEQAHAHMEGALEPTAVRTGAEVAKLPTTVAELLATFAQDEPTDMEVASWILEPDGMEQGDPEESSRAILARILMSETADEVIASREVTHAGDILGEGISIEGVKWQRSDHQQASSCYAVLTATSLNDARPMTITCGGRNVMMQLLKLRMLGAFPQRAMIQKSRKPTSNGYYPLWLEPA